MPPNTPHDRSPHPRAPYSPPAPFTHARPTTEARSTSYSSLDQALVLPSSSRDASDRRAHQSSRDAHRGGPSMSSESRYMPYSPAEPPAQYGYQYPPYDTAQYPPSASRPARPSAAQGQPSPSQQPPQQPPTSYAAPQASSGPYSHPPPHYTTTAYPVPNQSWQPEGWQPYSTSFAPSNASVSEPPQSFARPETQSQPPGKAARAPSAGPSNPDNRRAEERAERPSEAAPQPSKARKAREPVENAAPTPVTPTAALDFVKLVDTYRLILDSTTPLVNTTGHIDAERMEQMLQAAVYGAEALEAAAKRSAPELPRAGPTGIERSGNEPEGGTGKARQGNSSKSDQSVENQTCLGCNATSTPEWRRGPLGPRTLCNACGLVYAKLIKKRTREPGRVRSGHSKQSRADGYSSGDDGSDAESSGSHEKRSDMGEASRRG